MRTIPLAFAFMVGIFSTAQAADVEQDETMFFREYIRQIQIQRRGNAEANRFLAGFAMLECDGKMADALLRQAEVYDPNNETVKEAQQFVKEYLAHESQTATVQALVYESAVQGPARVSTSFQEWLWFARTHLRAAEEKYEEAIHCDETNDDAIRGHERVQTMLKKLE